MAATLRPTDAFDFAKRMVKNMRLEDVQLRILDSVNKMLWMAAPWRWTLGQLAAITLASNTQDYTFTDPGDLLYIVDAYLSDGNRYIRHLEPEPSLATAVGLVGQPSRISLPNSTTVRLRPKPGDINNTQQLNITYKKVAPVLTPSNVSTAGVLILDDEWFWVFEAGVLWLTYLFADDQRAGTTETQSTGQYRSTGQKAVFEAGIQQMREREPMPKFDARLPEPAQDRS